MKRKIKIHNYEYKIVQHSVANLTNTMGNCDSDNNTIYIDTAFPLKKQESSLAHEVLHAIFSQSGVTSLLGELEEKVVTIVEDQLYGFLKANTDFYERFKL